MRPQSCHVLTKSGWLGMSSMDDFKHDKTKNIMDLNAGMIFTRKFDNIDKSRPLSDALVVGAY